jgi:succinate dehydrogenase / fumarate reductase, membrane anchor subunit
MGQYFWILGVIMGFNIQTPLGRAKGLGSAKDGTHHWIVQRVTAIALIPLSLWFIFMMACFAKEGFVYADLIAWVVNPINATGLVLFAIAMFYHSALGVQVIIEDYVHQGFLKYSALLLNQIGFFALTVFSIIAILKIAL